MNWFVDTLSITIGMSLWFVPQISEHCPYRRPGRLIENLTWFSLPGVASVFTPSLGTSSWCCILQLRLTWICGLFHKSVSIVRTGDVVGWLIILHDLVVLVWRLFLHQVSVLRPGVASCSYDWHESVVCSTNLWALSVQETWSVDW
jgi:hypothetical protein